MKNLFLLLIVSFLLILSSIAVAENNGEVQLSFGYTSIDGDDNQSVSQETHNLYEGFSFSIENFRYKTNQGINFNANLLNTTRNDRNLRFSAYKPGLFNLSVYNKQYRRIYSTDGVDFTRRESTGMKVTVQPQKNFKLFGGFNYVDKDGTVSYDLRPIIESVSYKTAYTQYDYNFGATGFCNYGRLTVDFKNVTYQDDAAPGFSMDRTADQFNLTINTAIPNHKNIQLFGGYLSREDKMDSTTVTLKTTNGWGAVRAYLKNDFTLNFRMVLASTEHENLLSNTDNNYYTFSAMKTFKRAGGVRVGYEIRSSENDFSKTSATGYLLDGWYNINDWYFKGRYSFISSEVDKGSVLIGDNEKSKSFFSAKYKLKDFGSATGKVEKRTKEYNDIANAGQTLDQSKIDYTKASFELALKDKRYGKIIFGSSYYLGEYENMSADSLYEFSDYVVSTTLIPRSFSNIDFSATANYYRSRRDSDIEKFNMSVTAAWEFIPDHSITGTYKAYSFDDLLVAADTYTSNIIEFKFIKNLTF